MGRLNELTNLYGLANARDEYRTLYTQDALNPIEKKRAYNKTDTTNIHSKSML